eukprot:TRINITY_DN18_c0_g1_i1.p1 TRINITY_DN18_c0_g1~~TRINITY_DN18_c0_g1_i1.p1  ORF type:complete len:622 (+),score=157.53 TRINITY_DN18_c0_g1_i1:76-1941(+)
MQAPAAPLLLPAHHVHPYGSETATGAGRLRLPSIYADKVDGPPPPICPREFPPAAVTHSCWGRADHENAAADRAAAPLRLPPDGGAPGFASLFPAGAELDLEPPPRRRSSVTRMPRVLRRTPRPRRAVQFAQLHQPRGGTGLKHCVITRSPLRSPLRPDLAVAGARIKQDRPPLEPMGMVMKQPTDLLVYDSTLGGEQGEGASNASFGWKRAEGQPEAVPNTSGINITGEPPSPASAGSIRWTLRPAGSSNALQPGEGGLRRVGSSRRSQGPQSPYLRRKSSMAMGPRGLRPDEVKRIAERKQHNEEFMRRGGPAAQFGRMDLASWGTVYPKAPSPIVHCPEEAERQQPCQPEPLDGALSSPARPRRAHRQSPASSARSPVAKEATRWVDAELARFEDHMSFTVGERAYKTGLPRVSPAPPVATVLFQTMLMTGLRVVECLRRLPREDVMQCFESFATDSKSMSRSVFVAALQHMCGKLYDQPSADRLFDLFDRDHSGDVDLREVDAGLSVVLDGVAPAESMQFFFGLINQRQRFPRYITKFELQTLINMFIDCRSPSESDEAPAVMRQTFEHALSGLEFDYCGRASLTDFMQSLRDAPEAFRSLVGVSTFRDCIPSARPG